jgi:DNA-binding SARP family transcriptional activator/RecA/RadA recombinase
MYRRGVTKLDFRILSALEVHSDNGSPVNISRNQQRAALCVLLLHSGHPLTWSQLSDALWGDRAPGNPKGALISCIYGLRRDVGLAGRLHTHPVGYSIKLASGDTLDVEIFRQLTRSGNRSVASRDYLTATELFQQALDLWRKPALADMPTTPAIETEVAALVEQRLVVEESLIDARLALGRHEELVPALRALTLAHPLRERLWSRLMLALYRAGRQAEALRAYHEIRHQLIEQLGVDPGADLQEMHQRILAADPTLSVPGPSGPAVSDRADAAGAGGGSGPAGQPRAAKPASGLWIPVQLPPDVVDFTGRAAECASLVRALASAEGTTGVPICAIYGPPGVGKTTLAVHVAHKMRSHFPGGQLYLSLAGSSAAPRDPAEVLAEALRALGVRRAQIPLATEERTALYRSQLAGRRMLALVDDAPEAEEVMPLLPGTAGCAVIVTGREHLGYLPGARLIRLGPLDHGHALEFLKKIAGKERVESAQTGADDIVRACDMLPLAVRIAGVKLAERPDLPLDHLAAKLADGPLNELTVRGLNLRTSIEQSYAALEPRAQRAFRRLALAGREFAGWAVAVLLGEGSADDIIDTLVAKSMITPLGLDATRRPRYRLHGLLRDYAIEQLLKDPERDDVLRRLLNGWLELADVACAKAPSLPFWPLPARISPMAVVPDSVRSAVAAKTYEWLGVEKHNIIAAAHAACDAGMIELAYEMATRAGHLHQFGYHDEAVQLWLRIAAACGPHGEQLAQTALAAKLRAATALAVGCGRVALGGVMADQCVTAVESGAGQHMLAQALAIRAYCRNYAGRSEDAMQDAKRGLEIGRETGNYLAQLYSSCVIALIDYEHGSQAEFRQRCWRALLAVRELSLEDAAAAGPDATCLYQVVAGRAMVQACLGRGHYEVALAQAEMCLQASLEAGYELGAHYFSWQAGEAQHGLGQFDSAIGLLSRAADGLAAQHNPHPEAVLCRLKLAQALDAAGYPAEAQELEAGCLAEAAVLGMKLERTA